MLGTDVGSYRITQKVSVGGMGTVYRAEHTLIGKAAAVKVLHPELRSNREVVQRFFNEAKATTQIKHPGIVEIFDFGYLPSGDGYIVMEFLDGMSLAKRIETGGKMDEGEAAVLMRSVCSALAAAHAKGIVHRDLKPDNIFLCPDPEAPTGERPKILDFGIAKLNSGLTGPNNATKTGAVMGTPTYMSPEQCRGTGEIDARSDLYSIGCMFYEMVAGRPPFDNMAAGELIGAHLFIEPVSPNSVGAGISAEADALIMQLLQKQPAKRPQTAQELGRRFAELAQGHGFVARATPLSFPTLNERPVATTPDPKPSMPSSGSVSPRDSRPGDGVLPTLPSNPDMLADLSAAGRATPADDPDAGVSVSAQPTTLSGAASQSVLRNRGSRVGLAIGAIAALAIAGGAVMFAMKGSDKSSPAPASAPAAASDPTPAAVAPATAPTPAPAATPPAPTPPAVAPPAPAPATTPAVTPPVETTVTEPTTAAQVKATKPKKPATTRPVTSKPATTKPATTKPTTPDKPKPTTPDKPKPGTGSGSSILIETDI